MHHVHQAWTNRFVDLTERTRERRTKGRNEGRQGRNEATKQASKEESKQASGASEQERKGEMEGPLCVRASLAGVYIPPHRPHGTDSQFHSLSSSTAAIHVCTCAHAVTLHALVPPTRNLALILNSKRHSSLGAQSEEQA